MKQFNEIHNIKSINDTIYHEKANQFINTMKMKDKVKSNSSLNSMITMHCNRRIEIANEILNSDQYIETDDNSLDLPKEILATVFILDYTSYENQIQFEITKEYINLVDDLTGINIAFSINASFHLPAFMEHSQKKNIKLVSKEEWYRLFDSYFKTDDKDSYNRVFSLLRIIESLNLSKAIINLLK